MRLEENSAGDDHRQVERHAYWWNDYPASALNNVQLYSYYVAYQCVPIECFF